MKFLLVEIGRSSHKKACNVKFYVKAQEAFGDIKKYSVSYSDFSLIIDKMKEQADNDRTFFNADVDGDKLINIK